MSHEHDHTHEQAHAHGQACDCGHCGEKHMFGTRRILIVRLAAAAVLAALALLLPIPRVVEYIICILAFCIAGCDVLYTAVCNLGQKKLFDETFLMSIAGIACLIIGELLEAVLLMVLFQVGELLEDYALGNSRKSISRLMELRPDTVNVVRGGAIVSIPTEQAEVGEHIIVKPGERIGLDGVVVSGTSSLDTSSITGESLPRTAVEGDSVLSGFVNQSGALTVKITAPAGQSTVSRILDLVENTAEKKTPTERFITRFSKIYTPVVILLALLIAFLPPIFGAGLTTWVKRGLIFLVISCPCALVISVPLTYFAAIGGATKNGILFKGSVAIDNAAKIGTVVFDKTSTLTTGAFALTSIEPARGMDGKLMLMLAAHAEVFSSHPLASAVLKAYGQEVDRAKISESRDFAGLGVAAKISGITVCCGNRLFMERLGIADIDYAETDTAVYVALNNKYAGKLLFADTLKSDAKSAIFQLRNLGVTRLVMLSGDKQEAAERVAAELGITELHAECMPEDKTAHLERILNTKREKETVAFTGDGTNDAPVLTLADVGISMGGLGTDSAIEASDIVIMNDAPAKIAEAVSISRNTGAIVQQNILFSLGVKLLVMILGVIGIAPLWLALFADVGVCFLATLNAMRASNTENS